MRRVAIANSIFLIFGTLFAQQAGSRPQNLAQGSSGEVPTFRTQTETVLVPVAIVGKHAQHVSGLHKEDFRVLENGKEQTVASLEEFRPADNVEVQKPIINEYWNMPLELTYQPQLTILVLDLFNTSQLQRTDGKEQLLRFLSKELRGTTTFSLLCISSKGPIQLRTFTPDREEILKALNELNTEGYWVKLHQDAVSWTLEQVRQIAQAYAGVPGRKSMVWLSGNIPYPPLDAEVPFGSASKLRDEFDETRKSLLSANIAVYPVGLLASANDPINQPRSTFNYYQSLHYFADATGGNVCLESNQLSECLNEAVEDSRSYYMLSYTVKPDDRKPGWRKLEVKLNGLPGDVRARTGFFYEDRSKTYQAPDNHADEIAALALPLSENSVRMSVRFLGLTASNNKSVPDSKTAQFLLTIPLSTITVDPSRPDPLDLEIGAIALDKNQKEAGEFLRPLKGHPPPDALKQLAKDGLRLRQSMDLRPGIYDIRFFARDNTTGLIGTVVFPFEVK